MTATATDARKEALARVYRLVLDTVLASNIGYLIRQLGPSDAQKPWDQAVHVAGGSRGDAATTTQLRRLLDLAQRSPQVSDWVEYIDRRKERKESFWQKHEDLTKGLIGFLRAWANHDPTEQLMDLVQKRWLGTAIADDPQPVLAEEWQAAAGEHLADGPALRLRLLRRALDGLVREAARKRGGAAGKGAEDSSVGGNA